MLREKSTDVRQISNSWIIKSSEPKRIKRIQIKFRISSDDNKVRVKVDYLKVKVKVKVKVDY